LLNSLKAKVKMFRKTEGKIIATVRPKFRSSFFYTLAIASFLFPLSAQAKLLPTLKDKDFKRISFVGRCEQNQWSSDKNDIVEITMSAEPGESCEARLHLREKRELKDLGGMQFFVKSSKPRQKMAIELVGTTEGDPEDSLARTRPFTVTSDWGPDALRFQHMKKGWRPRAISEIRLIAMSDAGRRSVPTLSIRDVRFFSVAPETHQAGVVNEVATPAASDIPVDRQLVCVAADELSGLQAQAQGPRTAAITVRSSIENLLGLLAAKANRIPRKHYTTGAICFAWIAGILFFISRRKPSLVSLLSPLYEINTRTWKSVRDADGVHRLGGFNSLSVGDLKSIKASGFNSIWLMGIWDIGGKVRSISKRYGPDFMGSPFAISDYRVSEELGTDKDFDALLERARLVGLKVIVDFVPNHMGLDSDWLNSHPEFFIHRLPTPSEMGLTDAELEKRNPGFFVHRTPSYPEGRRRVPRTILVAYGKDPYFYPWIDTAQLDYAEPALRRKMTEVLCDLARKVDGVRCDMAMLVLREQVKIHRHPDMSWENFNRLMPEEFWPEAIHAAKRVKPTFTFMAETYWSMEGYLQQLGFDYTYNKPLYEALCSSFQNGHAEGLLNFIRMLGNEFLNRGVHFIENHDEERAMNALGEERQRAAAAVITTLPGVALIHQGQMEGKRERLPVQRVVPVHQEPMNNSLRSFYEGLLKKTTGRLFREGRLNVLYSNNPSFITYSRIWDSQKALIIVNTSGHFQKGSVTLMPGLHLKTDASYELRDIYYDLKPAETKQKSTVMPTYHYTASHLINQGLYVELGPYDAHIFLIESQSDSKLAERFRHGWRALLEGLPWARSSKRIMEASYLRTPDSK
jgi:glycosidase